MREESNITEVQPTSPPRKRNDGRYEIGVRYVCEDGRSPESIQTFRLLRDAKAEYARLPAPPKWETSACFDPGTGRLIATSTRITFGR